ncbi:MAG: nicotinamide mononucleotide transporter [Alistipes sp.]|uniref:nicotinamide riboside transporter PnuC n=1 Tax=Alistipes sp. TaxID=1872444 RepID=UPI0023F0C52D|nr:nicotinamide riboside transporter PnuC [Alistipes sp.]MBQ7894869.1 nicotinamide mononucleotide transporter [Alistipes sp.]
MDWKLILQIAGVLLGLTYLWLEYRADIRLWIVGLVMPVVHGTLYFKAGLYADCSMQVYYVLAGLYGWAVWHRTRRTTPETTKKAPAAIVHTPLWQVPGLVGVYLAAHAAIYLLLVHFTNSTVPFWDAATTAASIVAMWMLSRRQVEQWLVWLAVDVVTAGLYLYKEIPLTAGLYALYSALAVAGYLRWRRQAALPA